MQQAIEKAGVLIEALPYIQKFSGDTIVVKFGGSIMDDEDAIKRILHDIAFMACVGLRPVLVHGGGKAISRAFREKGIKTEFIQGLRVTDETSVSTVEHVLNHEVNPMLVHQLEELGCAARPMHGDDIIHVQQKTGKDNQGNELTWGYVGTVESSDIKPVEAFLESGITPVITPLGRGADRHIYNVNADEIAGALAKALKARKLVFLSDVPGVMEDPARPDSLFSTVHVNEVEGLMKRGVIQGGMLPKITSGVEALLAGVHKTHIIDANLPHSLLLELFTDRGVGTEIIQ